MLLPYLPVLNEKKIILGSQSKSRNELITTQVHPTPHRKSNMKESPASLQKILTKRPSPHPTSTTWKPAREKLQIYSKLSKRKENNGIY